MLRCKTSPFLKRNEFLKTLPIILTAWLFILAIAINTSGYTCANNIRVGVNKLIPQQLSYNLFSKLRYFSVATTELAWQELRK